MIGWLAGLLLACSPAMTAAHARRLAIAGLVAVAVLAAVGGFALWLNLHDRSVIEQADTERQLDEATSALEARDRADTVGATRDAARVTDNSTTADKLETIHSEDTAAAQAPASRGTRAVADRMR